MKFIIIICATIFLTLSNSIVAQSFVPNPPNGWTGVNDIPNGVYFSMPSTPVSFDSLDTKIYDYSPDTLVAMQTHIFKNSQFTTTEQMFNSALAQNNGDTLRAIAAITVSVTNSQLTSIQNITSSNGRPGVEFSIRYSTFQSSEPSHTFLRYFLKNNKFVSFSVTGVESDITRVTSLKNIFFGSIQIY